MKVTHRANLNLTKHLSSPPEPRSFTARRSGETCRLDFPNSCAPQNRVPHPRAPSHRAQGGVLPPPSFRTPHPPRYLFLAALLLFLTAAQSYGQGCAQCLDSTRATPPAVQAAYRHAIFLLGGCGVAIFVAGALLLRREP